MIEVKNLTKKYGEHVAVDNLSFTVKKGQILGFLGPNGAGKSTTMNIITGYISASDGSVSICGHDIYDEPEEAKKCIGYLPELPPLYQDMTVREYLVFVANIKKVKKSEIEAMLTKVMNMTIINDVQNRLIKHLSKGYKQRVGLAQAIIGFPEVLVLDEPTVGLDPMQIAWIRDLIKELSKDHAIILSSHILSEISAICDTVIIINKGKLIVSDTPDNLSKHTSNANALRLHIKGNKVEVSKALNSINSITKVEYEECSEEGEISLTAYSDKRNDIREEVFYALYEVKCPILGMELYTMTLEDIYLLVTGLKDEETVREEITEETKITEEIKINKEINKQTKMNKETEINKDTNINKESDIRKDREMKEDEIHASDL